MDDTNDENRRFVDDVEDRVWKFAKQGAPELLVYGWIHLRVIEDIRIITLKFQSESCCERRRDIAESSDGLSDVRPSLVRDQKVGCHFVPNSSSLISRQGRAEEGSS